MERRITPLTEGGLLAALTVVIALAAVYLPLLGAPIALLWPLPLAVLVLRHGLRQGVLALLVSGAALSMLMEPTISLRLVLGYGPLGLMLGYGYRRGWGAARLFALTLVAALLGELAGLGLIMLIIDANPFALMLDGLRETFDSTFALYEQGGLDTAELQAGREQVENGLRLVAQLGPLLVTLLALINTAAAYYVGGRVVERLGHEVPQLPRFSEWRLPSAFAYLFGFALVGIYWGATRELPWLYQLALNADMLAMMAGMVQGFALLAALMNHFRLSGFWRFFFYIMILLNGLFAQIIAFTGLFDMVFDYRRRFGRRYKNDDRG